MAPQVGQGTTGCTSLDGSRWSNGPHVGQRNA